MSVKIYKGKYKDISCVTLESQKLKIKLLPQSGGKIQSIFNKVKQKEYLYQTEKNKFKRPEYAMLFDNGDCSGFDDMFPTIDECYYPRKPWKGIKVPDHGEVWSIPWNYELKDDSIFLSVHGIRFPYKLEKNIKIKNENCLHIDYNVKNYSAYNFDFIWAAHPLFNFGETTEIILPKTVNKIMNVYNDSKRLGKYGEIHSWPVANTNSEDEYDMSKIYSKSVKFCEKYYVQEELKEGWASLYDKKYGDMITLLYPIKKVPYLGIWVNKGGFMDQYNVALEPCTGAFDGVNIANKWDKVSTVKANENYDWFLNIEIDN
ncbi:MAG: DUF5107 domain-containing protein [Halanaerobiales bacterium]|nr:DUF5107 domain-containing protein [Halanaerobiales bacterium]